MVYKIFEEIVERYGNKPAIVSRNKILSFNELHKLVDDISIVLIDRIHSSKYSINAVAISADKSFHSYAIALACLKIRVPFSYFDEEAPFDRVEMQFNVLGTPLIFVNNKSLYNKYSYLEGISLIDSKITFHYETESKVIAESDIAYIMFTSGTTGVPKGVAIKRSGIKSFIDWIIRDIGINSSDRVTGLNKQYFDNSIFDFFSTFFTGATLYPVDNSLLLDSRALKEFINSNEISVWFSVPSLVVFHIKIGNLFVGTQINKIIFGGEAFPKSMLYKLYNLIDKHKTKLISVYGPTEGTCICSYHIVSLSDFTNSEMDKYLPLGKISEYFDFFILNSSGELTKAIGTVGELVICGDSVAEGYYNNSEITKSSFFDLNSKLSSLGARCYKTGDLVQLECDDILRFIGRVDFQIKHNGHRVELQDIESNIGSIEGVDECCCFHISQPVSTIILVYSGVIDEIEIKKRMTLKLPNYMFPRKIIKINIIPKNANGKIDRNGIKAEYLKQLESKND